MNELTETPSAEKRPRVPVTKLLLTASTIVAAVVAVALTDPKIPPLVGD